MHEMQTVRALHSRAVEAARVARASRVVTIHIRIGALSHLSPDHLRKHFMRLTETSILAGARLDIVVDTDPTADLSQEVELVSLEVV